MTLEYVSVDDAIDRPGLRMVVVGDVPSRWGEAAKGILHIKRIPWAAVRLAYDSEPLKQWAGQRSGPVAIYDNEPPRAGWARDPAARRAAGARAGAGAGRTPRARASCSELSHEICGEGGLGWSRRLQLVHAGLQGDGGFPERVAAYLGKKYGYTPEVGAAAGARVGRAARHAGGAAARSSRKRGRPSTSARR